MSGTWDLGTRDEGLRDITMGRWDEWDGDAGRQIQGRGDVNEHCKIRR